MGHGVTGIDCEVMLHVQRMVLDSKTIDELCGKLAQYWDADEHGLQLAMMEWKERSATRQARAEHANRLLQWGKQRTPDPTRDRSSDEVEQEGALQQSRQIRLELLVEQIAEKVFPN